MHPFKSISVLIIVAFLFGGSIGFDVFAHFCEEDGLEISYFVEDSSKCAGHEHDKHHEKETHHDKHKSACCDEEDVGSCCTTSATHLQVKLDFFNKVLIQPVLVQEVSIAPVWHLSETIVDEDIQLASGSDPPPKEGRQVLIEIQQWLI